MIIVQALPIHEVSNIESVNTLSDSKNSKKIDWDKTLHFDHLSKEQKSKVINLLNKYDSVFAQDISELGQCGIVQHEIHLTDPLPTRQKPYRVPYQLKAEMKRQINTLLDAGIIQPSISAYAAPVLLVKKSDDSYRLVADLRKLHSKTIPDKFPLPNLNEMIDMLTGAKYFTTMDLTSGFHQMLLHPNSTHLTGTTEFGLFEYKRLPFGLRNASSSFQRLMSLVLNGLSDLQIGCYIDDIIIASNDFDQHLATLELVFQRLITANLKVKPSKCAFLQFEISFLGHTVKEGKVLPDSKNLKYIKDSLPPNSKKKVRTMLPDFSRPFSIFTDASKYSLGCVLVQEDAPTGFHHPIAFASRKLGPSEISYATVEKECLALVFAITHFKNYLYGAHFNVFSDQQCLSRVKTLKDPTSRIARWFLTQQQYDYTIIYKPGRLNFMADYLSRATYPADKQSDNTNSEEVHNVNAQFNVFNFSSIHELIEKQNKHPYCQNIKSKLNSNFAFSPKSPQFFIKDNLLLRKNNNMSGRHKLNTKLVVPQSLVPQILHLCHDIDAVAHPGLSRTMRRIQKNYFWRGQFRQVKNYIASCHECIQRRGYVKHIQRIPTADFPFQKCAFDAVGPVVISNHGNKWIIVISDYFTRYAEAYPVKNSQSSTVAHVLMDFIPRP
ncbi:Retrovirus-related Pol polyprotein from transposon 17.6 [Araneus ventricosus]|uniref:RNA-directed DNA polymerase n=1 Tax=Araneus ventricosus TaxID=182803 RepID=A0A4Y2P7T7_ARAVE|nr:Retrovirus-related Pol polyprotein from transposon 17.6 [Araneus ventricosus]